MKRMLLALACFLTLAAASRGQTIAVTGNLKNLNVSNATSQNTFVRFTLQDFGAQIPRVLGSGAMVSATTDFHPDNTGTFNGNIFPNDLITPVGTTYQVCIYNKGIEFQCAAYLITGAAFPTGFNLNTATPLSVTPGTGPTQLIVQVYSCVVSSPSTTWTCPHNFGDNNVFSVAFDNSSKQIVPDSVDTSNINSTTIKWVTPQAGRALLMHAGNITIAATQPNAIVSNPLGSQSVGGPGTTTFVTPTVVSNSFSANTIFSRLINSVRYVDAANAAGWSGSDAGAWINAAVTSLSGSGVVMVSPGTYTLSTTVTGASGVQIICLGEGACVLNGTSLTAGNHFFSFNTLTDVRVSGFTINGPAGAASGGSTDVRAFSSSGSTRLEVDHNSLNSVSYGVALGPDTDGNIHDNWITNIANEGVAVSDATRTQVRNNWISTVGGTSALNHGINYESGGDGVLIAGNHISSVAGFCIQVFHGLAGKNVLNTRIVDNYCKNGGQAASGTRGGIIVAAASPATTRVHRTVVSGNTIDSPGTGNPIDISGAADAVVADNNITTYQADGIVISGTTGLVTERISVHHNTLAGQTVAGNGLRATAAGSTLRNIDLSDNILDGVFSACIYVTGVSDADVHDNRCKDWNLQGSFSDAGVLLDVASLRTRIHDNIFSSVNCINTPPSIYVSDAGSTDTQIAGNQFINGCTTIVDAGTRTQIFGNKPNATDGNVPLTTAAAFAEGTPAGAGANFDVCQGNSSTHALQCSYNNDAFSQVVRFNDVGPVFNASGTQQTTPHTVFARGSLSSGTPSTATVTLSGAAVFTSNSSYNCNAMNNTTAANALKVTYTDGSHFVVTGPNTVTDSFSYICTGN